MKSIISIALTAIVAATLTGCEGYADKPVANASNTANTNAAANANTARPAAAAPSKETLMTMEKAGWEAWKNRDVGWTEENVSDKYVGFGAAGRMDKAASVKSFKEQKCEIKSYTLSDDQMQMAGPDVAILTFRAAQDYTCDAKKGPADVRSASVYVREGDKWKAAFYAETPAVDPKAPPKPAALAKKDDGKAEETKPDTATDALLTAEKQIWEGWKNKDGKTLEGVLGKDFVFYQGGGRSDRAAAIKMWSTDNKCDVKSYWLSDAKSVSLTKEVSLLTYKGGGDGTCEGQPITTEWYASTYIKEGEAWRPTFGMGISQQ